MGDTPNKQGFKSSRMAEMLEKIARIVPGVSHYQDKENIRHWDKELREGIAGKLESLRRAVEVITRQKADRGELKSLTKLNDINNKLDRVRDKIKFASYGYAGIFDPQKIREPELMKHYEFDLELAEAAEALETVFQGLKAAVDQGTEYTAQMDHLSGEIESLEGFFQQRQAFIVAEKPYSPSGKD